MKVLFLTFLILACFAHASDDDLAYFRQFQYREQNLEKDPDFPPRLRYWFLGSDFGFQVDLNATQFLVVQVEIFLNPDLTYDMVYNDGVGEKATPNQWMPRNCLERHGRWAVPDKTLLLYDADDKPILEGSRMMKDGQHAVDDVFQSNFPVSDVRGARTAFVMYQSEQQPTRKCFWH